MFLVGLEDLRLESRPQNVPGTVHEFPNWKRKAIRSLEAVKADEEIAELLRGLADRVERDGDSRDRTPTPSD